MQGRCKGSETRLLGKNLVSFVLLLSIVLIGCRGRADPDKGPPYSGPKPTPTPYKAYLPGASSGGTSAVATPTVLSVLPSPIPAEQPPSKPTPLPPPIPKPGYGVQIHLFAGDVDETLHWAEGLGVGWVKQWVAWDTVEHEPGDFEWEPLDRAVEACHARGFKLLITVVNAPDWTRPSEPGSGIPADYAEFGRFVGQLASRYRGRVAAYELWNEANLAREWRGDTLDPARFVAYVAEGAQGVRAADPAALIISGAPAVTGIDDGVVAIDDRAFLRGMYEAGIAQWVDGIGAHPYGFANPPAASWQDATHVSSSHNDHPSFFFRDTLEDYHAIMRDYGDTDHQIWVTEFGWPSTEGMGRMDVTGWEYGREVSEAQQANYIVRAFRMGDERPWVGPMFLWNLNLATIWGSRNPTSAYSLLRPDRSYRPAYVTLRLAEPLAP